MPSMSRPTPLPEESHRALQQILADDTSGSTDLPNLAPPSWTGALQRILTDALEKLDEALSYVFGKRSPLEIDPQSLDAAFTLILYLGVIVVIAVVGTFVYRVLGRYSSGGGTSRTEATSPPLSAKELDTLIDEALKSGDIAKATRLMWRAFVMRWDMTPNTTPHEYMRVYPERLPENCSTQLYTLMYSGAAARADFEICRKLLERGAGDAII